MFQDRDKTEYRSKKAPDELKNRTWSSIQQEKKRMAKQRKFVAAIAACFVMVFFSSQLMNENSISLRFSQDGPAITSEQKNEDFGKELIVEKENSTMKKLTALLLAVAMVFTCVACGNSGNAGNSGNGGNGGSATITDATELLTKTWEEYNKSASEDVKFPIGGGDAENMTMDVPGKYDVTVEGGAEGLTSTYCVPEDVIAKIDDVATGMHMMMSNNFTAVACHVTNAADVESVVSGIKEATLNNRWMCGMPEELLIVTVGEDYVVSVFGLSALVDTFQTALTTVYGDAVVVSVEENIAE